MKNWLMAVGGALALILGIWLIVFFAPRVLVFLESIVGILAGIAGGVLLFLGIDGIKTQRAEKGEKTAEAGPEKK
jgi:threonine/homoserine/homoserine lactone efflux protein